MVDWKTCKQDFEWDGSWRDIYVFETTLEDWQLLFELIRTQYRLQASADGIVQSLPSTDEELHVMSRECNSHWTIRVGGILIVCHFFSSEQMEFHIDPREVTSQADLDTLLAFIQRLGDAIKKSVVLTLDNGPEIPIISYHPKTGSFQYHEIGA